MVDWSLFEEVADAVRGMAPPDLGELHCTTHRYGIKVWFGPAKPTREHYEAQVVGREHAPGASVLALEVGFHAENPKEADNEAVIAVLRDAEPAWRRELGDEPVIGSFVGRAERWRRVSEVWPDPALGDRELAFEVAARLTDYITVLEPCRRR